MSKIGGGPDGALVPVSDSPSGQSDLSVERGPRRLTAVEFQGLADVPPEAEWFANIDNVQTRRAYKNDLAEFMTFVGISAAGEFRIVTRSHIIA